MDRIDIHGYKSIKDLSLKLEPINILIGANGSGKSNFLSFFDFLKQVHRRNLQEFIALKGIDTFLHKGDKITEEISAHLYLPDSYGYSLTIKKGNDRFIITKEGLLGNTSPKDKELTEIATLGTESDFRFNDTPRGRFIIDYLDQLAKYHFHDTGENSPFSKESNIENDKYFLYEKGSNLGAFLYGIKENEPIVYNLIIKTIQSIAPYFLDFFLRPESNGNIRVKWQSKHSSSIYGVNDLSDGTIRFIALATLFLQPNLPKTIIIDEPELGLHPAAITKLAGLIKSVAAKGCQVIIATQSTDLISHFNPEDIITVDQKNGESVFQRLDPEKLKDWLEDYTIDDLWKRNIIATGQPNFQ